MRLRKRIPETEGFRMFVEDWPDWAWQRVMDGRIVLHDEKTDKAQASVHTTRGVMVGLKGDWLIKDGSDVTVMRDEVLQRQYEPIEE